MNDLILLSLLVGKSQHGYVLKKQAGAIFGQAEMHNNLVYPLLKRFVNSGWIAGGVRPDAVDRRAKCIRSLQGARRSSCEGSLNSTRRKRLLRMSFACA